MNLYVDDRRPVPPGWHLARTVDEAIRVLSSSMRDLVDPVELVSLDHDISYEVKLESGEVVHVDGNETFQPVARYIALMPLPLRPDVIFHTANHQGEMTMRAILETEHAPELEPA